MGRIRSKKELLYNSRENKRAIVELDVIKWTYNTTNNRYYVEIQDYAITNIGGVEVKTPIGQIIYRDYHSDNICALFTMIGSDILHTQNFTTELRTLISKCLLFMTVNDTEPIYGSINTDWIIWV